MIKPKKKKNAIIKLREKENHIKLLHHGHGHAFIQEKVKREEYLTW